MIFVTWRLSESSSTNKEANVFSHRKNLLYFKVKALIRGSVSPRSQSLPRTQWNTCYQIKSQILLFPQEVVEMKLGLEEGKLWTHIDEADINYHQLVIQHEAVHDTVCSLFHNSHKLSTCFLDPRTLYSPSLTKPKMSTGNTSSCSL